MNLVSVPEKNNSRTSARSKGSSMSRNQSLIAKNVQPHDLEPVEVLIGRFVAWKAVVQQLIDHFKGITEVESNSTKKLTKLSKAKLAGAIQVPSRAGNQFLSEGGLQDMLYNIRDKTRIIADQHADLGQTVDSSIVQHLQKLRGVIKAHIKNIQNDTGKLATGVAKEREISTRLVGKLANDVSAFKNTPTIIASKNDPYVANQAVARRLPHQVSEENPLQKSIIMIQKNSVHIEEGIVQSIRSVWQTFYEQSRAFPASQDIFRSLSTHLVSLAPDHEWIQSADENDDICADGGNRDVDDHVHPTESAPETRGGGFVPAVGTGEPTARPSAADDLQPHRLDGNELEAIAMMEYSASDMLIQPPPKPDFKELERRIQTLTSILQNMKRQHSPTNDRSQVPAFLRHLATLLACGNKDDADAKRVIAVTGSLTDEESQTLVVTQNPFGPSQLPEFRVKEITKSTGTFEEVMKGDKNAKLPKHISDVWAAIDLYDPDAKHQFHLFGCFIVTRCFRKLSKRVSQDKCWGVSVSRKIYEWIPLSQEGLADNRWIERPVWAFQALPPGMKERKIQKFGQSVTQWEFSAATLRSWAWLLAKLLQQVELAIGATKVAREKKLTDEESKGFGDIHGWCHRLHAFVHWKEDVVKTLLTKTSLAHAFNLRVVLNMDDGAEDEPGYMRREPGESEGQQVLRHLQAIVAWHAAATSLLDKKSHHVTRNLRVGLVEVTQSKSNLMTSEEVIQEFFHRQPTPSPDARISIQNRIRENHTMKFHGTIHAEATLMGLLTYFSPNSLSSVIHGKPIDTATLHLLNELIMPATFEKAIAVGKKCCWCCDRLGSLLGGINLPGSHGIFYSWTPPRVGVDVTVLQALENELWDEMNVAVGDTVSSVITHQSSGSSTEVLDSEGVAFSFRETRAGEW